METDVIDFGYHGAIFLFLFRVLEFRVGFSASGDFSPSLFAPGCIYGQTRNKKSRIVETFCFLCADIYARRK